jgi:hypothetical protein
MKNWGYFALFVELWGMLKTNVRSALQWKMMTVGENGPENLELINGEEVEDKPQGG